jgi:hypothetical protein
MTREQLLQWSFPHVPAPVLGKASTASGGFGGRRIVMPVAVVRAVAAMGLQTITAFQSYIRVYRAACDRLVAASAACPCRAEGAALDRFRGSAAAAADRKALQAPVARPLLGQQDFADRVGAGGAGWLFSGFVWPAFEPGQSFPSGAACQQHTIAGDHGDDGDEACYRETVARCGQQAHRERPQDLTDREG